MKKYLVILLSSFILFASVDALSKQDCDYVKIVKYSDGKIISSKTEYVCDSPPTIIVEYEKEKEKTKAEKWAEYFKPIRPSSSPDPTYYGNYANSKPTVLDAFFFAVFN